MLARSPAYRCLSSSIITSHSSSSPSCFTLISHSGTGLSLLNSFPTPHRLRLLAYLLAHPSVVAQLERARGRTRLLISTGENEWLRRHILHVGPATTALRRFHWQAGHDPNQTGGQALVPNRPAALKGKQRDPKGQSHACAGGLVSAHD